MKLVFCSRALSKGLFMVSTCFYSYYNHEYAYMFHTYMTPDSSGTILQIRQRLDFA